MTVPFKELGGSPMEYYDAAGFRARREFLVAWEDRDAFAEELLGSAARYGATSSVHYPGKVAAFAASLRYEPFDPENPDLKSLYGLTEDLNSYTNSFAKATVEYRTVSSRDRADGPENEPGTHLTYRMLFDVEQVQITPQGWKWADQPSIAAPADVPLLKTVPVTDHHLTWHQVTNRRRNADGMVEKSRKAFSVKALRRRPVCRTRREPRRRHPKRHLFASCGRFRWPVSGCNT